MKKIYTPFIILLTAVIIMAMDPSPTLSYFAPSKSVAQAGIVINGNNLYIANNDTLVSYDISQPGTPAETGREKTGMTVDTLYMFKQNLVVCRDNFYGTVMYDVSSGGFGQSGIYWPWTSCKKVVLYGDKAFVTDKPGYSCSGENPDGDVRMYTISDNAATSDPIHLPVENVSALAVTDNTVYASMESQGFAVIDVATNLIKTTFPDKVYYSLQISGTKLYGRSKTSLDCYDISNAQSPKLISQLSN
ncbi:hypothetical protein [Chitinophaga sp.]|uniref:hypothetical protein n=1 Tax=Chitinophaga sp. TaxID=1869181 RepID=UPI0031D6DA8F